MKGMVISMKHRKNKEKRITKWLIVLLTAVSIFCTTQTVLSRGTDAAAAERERYFDAMEKDYVENIKALLREKGYADSGVMLTAVISEDRMVREYTVSIHNKRFDRLSESGRAALISELEQTCFPEEGCSFSHLFL